MIMISINKIFVKGVITMNSKKCMCLIVFLFTVTVTMFSFSTFAQETALPSVDSIVAVYENEKATKVKTEISNLNQNGTLIVALYKDGKLLSCKDGAVTSGTKVCSLEFSDSDIRNADSAKAFIWDTLSGMKAISDVKEVSALLPSGIVKLNYKRNDSGEQAFLYKFGTTGSKVEISIENNDDYKMSDLDISVVPVENKSNIVKVGETGFAIDAEQSTDTYKKINFTGNILGIVDLNVSIKGTNVVQDTMRIEILKDYKNIDEASDFTNDTVNFCLVPTLKNVDIKKSYTFEANSRVYGNDCKLLAGSGTLEENTYFLLSSGAFVENIRLEGNDPGYSTETTVILKEGATLKNAYVKHGATSIFLKGTNSTLEDVTVECSPIPIKVEDGISANFNGNILIDGIRTGACKDHVKGNGIAIIGSNKQTVINLNGNLKSYNFMSSTDASNLTVKLPASAPNNYITFSDKEYINPIIVLNGKGSLVVNEANECNLQGLCSSTKQGTKIVYTYNKNSIGDSSELSYLLSKPEAYATEVEFETFKYTMSGIQNSYNAKLSESNVVDFSNVKFNKYSYDLPYDMHVFEVTSGVEEEYVTTTYTLTNGLFDSTTKKLTLPSDASTSKEYYGIFEVTDIYDDNKQYNDYNTTIKCVE